MWWCGRGYPEMRRVFVRDGVVSRGGVASEKLIELSLGKAAKLTSALAYPLWNFVAGFHKRKTEWICKKRRTDRNCLMPIKGAELMYCREGGSQRRALRTR